MRDPKKAQQNEELMGLYKKHGVNPMGGCLPMLLQLPFFIGFYNVLMVAIEMRHASWLWVTDLSTFEHLPIRVLPLAMVATQFWQQSLTPTPTADPAQMRLMKFMPLMMGFIFYQFQAGLVLFWLTSNVVGVAQQLILNRFASDEPVLDDKSRGRKKKGKNG
jgi:YidC/Oxa1 family membrane protein insertase